MMAESDVRLMPYENAEGMEGTRRILESIEPGESIAILIGPEGGIDEAEVEMAMKEKVEPITLGKRILRTETAGMTVLSILVYLLEGRERTRQWKHIWTIPQPPVFIRKPQISSVI